MLKFLKRKGDNTQPNGRCLIELFEVRKIYKTDAGDFPALKHIDLKIGAGEFVGIVGKSGSGKSTLVNMITGIDHPTSGEVYVNGTSIHHLNEGQMAKWRGVSMGVVFQFFQLLPTLTAIENVMLPMDFCNVYSSRKRRDRAMYLLELMDVGQQANKLPTMLSGGQQQRVAIARALANDPPIIVADEPTGNLDTRTADQVFALFAQLVADGKTIVMVTHDDDLAGRLQRIVTIADGEIINENLSKVFPKLSYDMLLHANHNANSLRFQPGAAVLNGNGDHHSFYIVTEGMVEVATVEGRQTLEPGQFFEANSPTNPNHNPLSVQVVSNTPAELLALDQETMTQLTNAAEAARR